MDSVPTNIDRFAPPFSLDAARQRHQEPASPQPTEGVRTKPPRRHPRLELVAGSSVPDATLHQITDARERFLSRITAVPPTTRPPALVGSGAVRPSMALLRRMPPILLSPDGGDRPGA